MRGIAQLIAVTTDAKAIMLLFCFSRYIVSIYLSFALYMLVESRVSENAFLEVPLASPSSALQLA